MQNRGKIQSSHGYPTAHQQEQMTMVRQQRQFGLIDQFEHGQGQPFLGVEEVVIHVLMSTSRCCPEGRCIPRPPRGLHLPSLLHCLVCHHHSLLNPFDGDGLFCSSGRRPVVISLMCTWRAAPPSRQGSWVSGGRILATSRVQCAGCAPMMQPRIAMRDTILTENASMATVMSMTMRNPADTLMGTACPTRPQGHVCC